MLATQFGGAICLKYSILFLEIYYFNDKTVIPFSTHGESGLAEIVSTIKNKISNANVEDNTFAMSRNNIEKKQFLVLKD